MKNPSRFKTNKIMELLKGEYVLGRSPAPKISASWQDRVMVRIREERGLESPRFLTLFGQFAWRLVPVTCSLTVVLAALAVRAYLAFDYDLVQVLVNHAEDLMFTQLLGG
jgi:hypothetical protein